MKRYFLTAALLLSASLLASAQETEKQYGYLDSRENDFTGRVGATLGYKPVKGLSLTLSEELRAGTLRKGFDRSNTSIGIEYSPFKRFDIIGEYTFSARLRDKKLTDEQKLDPDFVPDKECRMVHKGDLGLAYTFKMGYFRLQLREMVQCTFRQYDVDLKRKANPALYLRSRVKLSYHIPTLPLTPYAYFELFNTLNAKAVVADQNNTTTEFRAQILDRFGPSYTKFNIPVPSVYVNRYRAGAGVKYDFNGHTSLKAYYLFDDSIYYNVHYKGLDKKKEAGKINRITKEVTMRHTLGVEVIHYF